MTLDELKAYTDALIDATGDENLKRVRAKMDQVAFATGPVPAPVFIPPCPQMQPLTAPVPPGWPTVTCGTATLDTDPDIQVWNA